MHTKDFKQSVPGTARPMIAPKVSVSVATDAGRQQVVHAARKVIAEHRDVIKALAKR